MASKHSSAIQVEIQWRMAPWVIQNERQVNVDFASKVLLVYTLTLIRDSYFCFTFVLFLFKRTVVFKSLSNTLCKKKKKRIKQKTSLTNTDSNDCVIYEKYFKCFIFKIYLISRVFVVARRTSCLEMTKNVRDV